MNTIAFFAPIVNPVFEVLPSEADEYRPTAGPDFVPTVEEDAEASQLLNADEPDDSDPAWDRWAEDALLGDLVCGLSF